MSKKKIEKQAFQDKDFFYVSREGESLCVLVMVENDDWEVTNIKHKTLQISDPIAMKFYANIKTNICNLKKEEEGAILLVPTLEGIRTTEISVRLSLAHDQAGPQYFHVENLGMAKSLPSFVTSSHVLATRPKSREGKQDLLDKQKLDEGMSR